ncbi:Uncharacterised protein [Vibrio cholerae]|nr:Uncharacterised protein [Vibrio cholerae]
MNGLREPVKSWNHIRLIAMSFYGKVTALVASKSTRR